MAIEGIIFAAAFAFVAVMARHALPVIANRPPWWWR